MSDLATAYKRAAPSTRWSERLAEQDRIDSERLARLCRAERSLEPTGVCKCGCGRPTFPPNTTGLASECPTRKRKADKGRRRPAKPVGKCVCGCGLPVWARNKTKVAHRCASRRHDRPGRAA